MIDHLYEHHVAIRQNKMCPFKLVFLEQSFDCVCNWHKNIEVILVTEGSGTIAYGHKKMDFTKNDMIIVNSDVLHRLYSVQGISYYYLIIDETFCAENGISTRDRSFTPILREENANRLFEAVVSALGDYYGNREDLFHLNTSKARLAVLSLLIALCENHSLPIDPRVSDKRPSEDYVKRVISYLGDHYREPLTLESLARICGITKCYLAREFKSYTGQTVLTYLNTLRSKHAEACLAEGMSVTETAYECGFESISYFSRTYKKIIGVPPSKIRKKRPNP
jgi:AraC-like DNA-binding protein